MTNNTINLLNESSIRVKALRKDINSLFEKKGAQLDTSSRNEPLLISIESNLIYLALARLNEALANSYMQVKLDLQEENRVSWAGTAHEIREILATTLRLLAPDSEVTSQSWYKPAKETNGPTQKQRVKYILSLHSASSKEEEVVEQVVNLEEMLGNVIRATYSRASDAAHTFKPKKEVLRILRYFDAFAHDLLNLE